MKAAEISRATQARWSARIKKALRLGARADEIVRSGSAAEQLVARELYVEALAMHEQVIQEMQQRMPWLRAAAAAARRAQSK